MTTAVTIPVVITYACSRPWDCTRASSDTDGCRYCILSKPHILGQLVWGYFDILLYFKMQV